MRVADPLRGCTPPTALVARVLACALLALPACGADEVIAPPSIRAAALVQGCDCASPTWTFVDQGTATPRDLRGGRSLCIDGGVFTGGLELDATSLVCVDDDASWQPSFAVNLGGRVDNHGVIGTGGAPLSFTAIAGTTLANHGKVFVGSANFNGPTTITNVVDATIDFTTSFALRNGSSMTNLGVFRAVSNFDTSADSVFVNEGYGYITGQLSFEGASDNKGLLEITAKVNVNSGATFANTCTIVSHGTYNVSGNYINDGLVYLHADTDDLHFNVTGGGHMTQGPQGLVQVTSLDGIGGELAANLRVDGRITGAGALYVEDETVCQGSGLVAGSAEAPIALFDATPTLGQICDIQTGTLEHVVRGPAPVVLTLARAQLGTVGSDCRTLGALHCHDDHPPEEVDTGCDEARPWCDTSGEVRRCVACFTDADCTAPHLCIDGTCQNPAPVASGDTLRVAEGGTVAFTVPDLIANDRFVDPSTFVLEGGGPSLVTPAGGLVVFGPDGLTYTPPPSPPARDDFVYHVCGTGTAAGECVSAIVNVLINRAPEPDDTRVWVAVGTTSVVIDPRPLFHDVDGDDPAPGTGPFTIAVPDPGTPGVQVVGYEACDDGVPVACGTGTVTLYVNDPPVLADLELVGGARQSLIVPLSSVLVGTGVLAGDDPRDGDTDAIGLVDVSGPCAVDVDGDIVVTTAAAPGTAVCVVTVCEELPPDDARVCATADITIRTASPPTAADDVYWGLVGVPVGGRVTSNDTIDPAGFASVVVLGPLPAAASVGTVTVVGEVVTLTPVATFAGQVSIVYELHDGLGQIATATVTFVVNDPPVLTQPQRELAPGATSAVPLGELIVGTGVVHGDLPDDGDSDGIGTITVTTGTGMCTLVGGAISITAPGSPGRFVCNVRVCEERPTAPASACATTPIVVIVPGADPPVANDDAYAGAQGAPLGGDVTVNDTVDVARGAIELVTVLGPTPDPSTQGVVTAVGEVVTFTPVASFVGTLQVVYRLADGMGQSDTATITFLVNDPPVLDDPEVPGPPGVPVRVPLDEVIVGTGVVHGDDPGDGDTDGIGTITIVSGPCTLDGDDVVITTGAASAEAPTAYVCRVRVCEERPVACAETPVSVIVPALPEAADDAATTPEDTATTIVVGANDDPGLTVTAIDRPPAHGTVTIDPSGTITYRPAADWNGTDTFDYETCNALDMCTTATVVVTVSPVPDAPIAGDDTASTATSTAVTIDLLGNDHDPDGDALTVTAVTTPAHGTVGIDGVYTPEPGYRGSDTFDYTVCDTTGRCDTGRVTVTVGGDNQTPIGGDDHVTVGEDGTTTIPVLDNDGDPDGDDIYVDDVTQPGHGTVTIDDDGAIVYTPDPDFAGEDTFTYTVCDTEGACTDVTVTVTVTPVADPPVAVDDARATPFETAITFDVRDNDLDVDGDALTVASHTTPASGTLVLGGDGRFTFTPAAGMSGVVTFDYVVSDPGGLTDDARVTITVGDDPDPNGDPEARDDLVTVPAGDTIHIVVLSNDDDPDGDGLVITSVTEPEHGTVTINPDGTITYTPDDGYIGEDAFTYTVSDGRGGSDSATVRITVVPDDDFMQGIVAEGGGGCGAGGAGSGGLVGLLAACALTARGWARRGRARRRACTGT